MKLWVSVVIIQRKPICLPNGYLTHDVEVYCSDIDDYDMLVGMDIITLTDFCITNKDKKTRFTFRTPSEGEVKLL